MTLLREMAGEIEVQGLMWVPPLLVPYRPGGILDIRQMAQPDTYKGRILALLWPSQMIQNSTAVIINYNTGSKALPFSSYSVAITSS